MTITITAESLGDASSQLGLRERRNGINITWRKGYYHGYHDSTDVGCIVDATDISTEEVKRCFTSSAEALRYIASLLKRHDTYARETRKKYEKEERKRIKDAAKKAQCR